MRSGWLETGSRIGIQIGCIVQTVSVESSFRYIFQKSGEIPVQFRSELVHNSAVGQHYFNPTALGRPDANMSFMAVRQVFNTDGTFTGDVR